MAEIRVQDEQGNVHVFPDGSTPEMIAKVLNVKPPANSGAQPSFFDDPRAYLQNRATSLQQEAQNQMNMAVGPESANHGTLARLGHSLLSLAPETAAVVDKLVAGGMDWKNAIATAAGVVDPAIPAAYFGGHGTAQLTGLEPGINKGDTSPENVQNALLAGSAVAGGAAASQSTAAGRAANPRPAVSRALLLGRTPQEAYQSALKPSTTLGDAKTAQIVQTGLDQRIPVSKGGVEAIGNAIDSINQQITNRVNSGAAQGVTVDPRAVAARTADTRARFANQVTPSSDLAAIDSTTKEFLDNNQSPIPADKAQAMKVGTYRVLSGKYGEQGSATVETQKALARGLKEELATQFPEIKQLNAQESRLLDLQPVLERAVSRIGNHQLIGIGTPIATGAVEAVTKNAGVAVAAGVLKAVLDNPAVKSRLAIALNKTGVPYPQALARVASYQQSLGQAALSATGGLASQSGTPNQ